MFCARQRDFGMPIRRGASYKFSKNLSAFVKVDNAGDTFPVAAPQNNLSFGINPSLYDVLGRTYRAGLRYSL